MEALRQESVRIIVDSPSIVTLVSADGLLRRFEQHLEQSIIIKQKGLEPLAFLSTTPVRLLDHKYHVGSRAHKNVLDFFERCVRHLTNNRNNLTIVAINIRRQDFVP